MIICLIIAIWLILGLVSILVLNKLLKKANVTITDNKKMVDDILHGSSMTPEIAAEFWYSLILTTKIGYLLGCVLWPVIVIPMVITVAQFLKEKHTR